MTFRSENPKHQRDFTYSKTTKIGDAEVTVAYKDRGWANGGVPYCDCDRSHKEEYDNSMFVMRGTDIIYICHNCKSFLHVDMSD